jgi:hypothetical protein
MSECGDFDRLRPRRPSMSECEDFNRLGPRRPSMSKYEDFNRLRPRGHSGCGRVDTQERVNGDLNRVNSQGQGPNDSGQDTPTGRNKGPARWLL